jgi:uncharacterized phage protein gp47/JayE
MIDYLLGTNPTINTAEGSIVNDVIMTAPAGPISQCYDDIDLAAAGQSIETAPDGLIEVLGANVGVIRKSAQSATGVITFYKQNAPTTDITIPAGTVVGTVSSTTSPGIQFTTLQSVTMYAALATGYLNPVTGWYEQSVSISAVQGGVAGVVGSQTITSISSYVSGIDGCYNAFSTANGSDIESLTAYQARVGAKYLGNTIGTTDGILSAVLAQPLVQDATVVGHGLSPRGQGAVDVYIKGFDTQLQTDVSQYAPDLVLAQQPVVPEIAGGVVLVQTSASGSLNGLYSLVQDTGGYAGSVLGQDYIACSGSVDPSYGTFYITYHYNALVSETQALFNNTDKDVLNTSVLVKQAQQKQIDVAMQVFRFQGFDITSVKNAVATSVATLLAGYGIGQQVSQGEVVRAVLNTAGVQNVNVPFSTFQSTDGTILQDANGNLEIPAYAYAAAGNFTINIA